MTREQLLIENEKKIRAVVLTDQEKEEAIFEGQKKKYFHEKNKEYWQSKERGTKIVRSTTDRPT